MTWKGKVFLSLMAGAFLAIAAICIWNHQNVFVGNIVKNPDCYILEFEKMNQEDWHELTACKDDALSVSFRIDAGYADFVIGMDGRSPIYTGNDIKYGVFDVIVPENGEYRITVNARHAAGSVNVFMKKG